jgi:crotonobetainyl-CoA:carnitine CoA-transferase CaiB-like acyl-CoA transferase
MMTEAALSGIRIVDLGGSIAVAAASMILADAGADVVMVEPPGGSPLRALPGFRTWGRNKRSVTIDLTTFLGRSELDTLLAHADVLLHSITPTDATWLGLTDTALAVAHPNLIVSGVLAWPALHAAADAPVEDALMLARLGVLDEQLGRRDGPIYVRFPLGTWPAAWLAVVGIMARIVSRGRTGLAGPAHTSLAQGALVPMMMHWSRAETPSALLARGMPKKDMRASLFECGDGRWIHIMPPPPDNTPLMQEVFAEMGPELVAEANARHADRAMAGYMNWGANIEAFKRRTSAEWLANMWASDIPAQEAAGFGAILSDEQARANGYVLDIDDPDEGPITIAGLPFTLDPPTSFRSAAPQRSLRVTTVSSAWARLVAPPRSRVAASATSASPSLPHARLVVPSVVPTTVESGGRLGTAPWAPPGSAKPPNGRADVSAVTAPWAPPTSGQPRATLADEAADTAALAQGAATSASPSDPFGLPSVPVATGRFPLEGLKVLDFGNFLAGPLGPMLLADLGATVVKVETTTGDPMRAADWPFAGCQRGKRAVALDIKSPASRPALEALLRWADVVHHNLRMPAARRLGLDAASVRAVNPDVVFCHVSSYGPIGPRADWPGYDQMFQSSCGWEVMGAGAGNPPMWHRFGFMDHLCAMASAAATLMAVYQRDTTGRATDVSASLLGTGVMTNSETFLRLDGTLMPVPQLDSTQTTVGPGQRIIETADGWVAVAAASPSQIAAMCAELGVPTHAQVAEAARTRSQAELLAAFLAAGVPAAGVAQEQRGPFFDDPDHLAAGLVARYRHEAWGTFEQPGALWHFGNQEVKLDRAPPVLGQHTIEVLLEVGMARADIDALVAAGAAVAF